MKHSELIREAKKWLWDGNGRPSLINHEFYVCYCLTRVQEENEDIKESDRKKIDEILARIRKKIGSVKVCGIDLNLTRSVEDWLNDRGFKTSGVAQKWLQDYRARWMDAMIKEWEDKGK